MSFTSPPYGLAPGIHVARLGERIVVLDRRADTYSLLIGPVAQALTDLLATETAPMDELEAAGVVARGSDRRPAPITPATREHEAPREPISPTAWLGAYRACAATAAALRWRGLDATCRRLEAMAPASPTHRPLGPALAAYASARRWFPRAPRCLFDSLALLAALRARRLPGRAVFGVRLDPFQAHCWVEVDDAVVNDRLATIAPFTPIMVV